MFRSVSLLLSLLIVLGLATPLLAQRTARVGVSVVPALNRTIDVGVEIGNGNDLEFFGQAGYFFGGRQEEPDFYGSSWFESSGGFLKVGGRITSTQTKRWRVFAGPQFTTSLVRERGGGMSMVFCDPGPCPTPFPKSFLPPSSLQTTVFSVGGSAGVSVQILKRLEVDLGVELNKVLFGEERLIQPDAYKPGIGSTPFQALLNVQYRLK